MMYARSSSYDVRTKQLLWNYAHRSNLLRFTICSSGLPNHLCVNERGKHVASTYTDDNRASRSSGLTIVFYANFYTQFRGKWPVSCGNAVAVRRLSHTVTKDNSIISTHRSEPACKLQQHPCPHIPNGDTKASAPHCACAPGANTSTRILGLPRN